MSVFAYIYENIYNKTQKKEILDPLTTIIRLAILSFKNDGTKISISNNTFYLQEPTMLQAPIRWGYGDKREDLHNLYNPIEKCLEWYNIQKYPFLKNIYLSAIDGLNKLKKSYSNYDNESSIISHSLSYYSNLILKFLGETTKEFKIKSDNNSVNGNSRNNGGNRGSRNNTDSGSRNNTDSGANGDCGANGDSGDIDTNCDDGTNSAKVETNDKSKYDFLKTLWSAEEIKIISDLFAFIKKDKSNNDYIIKTINCLLEEKDENVKDYVNKLSTSID